MDGKAFVVFWSLEEVAEDHPSDLEGQGQKSGAIDDAHDASVGLEWDWMNDVETATTYNELAEVAPASPTYVPLIATNSKLWLMDVSEAMRACGSLFGMKLKQCLQAYIHAKIGRGLLG